MYKKEPRFKKKSADDQKGMIFMTETENKEKLNSAGAAGSGTGSAGAPASVSGSGSGAAGAGTPGTPGTPGAGAPGTPGTPGAGAPGTPGARPALSPARIFHLVLLVLQSLLSAGVLYYIFAGGLLPAGLSFAGAAAILVTFVISMFLQLHGHGALRSAGAILSIFLCGMLVFGFLYLQRIDRTLTAISDAQMQTDEMVVVVRSDDPAETIEDTAGYRFGISSTGSTDRLTEMIADIESRIATAPEVTEYPSPVEQGNALLAGETDALIYNSAITSMMDEVIENYSDQVRIIYTKEFTYEVSQDGSADAASAGDQQTSDPSAAAGTDPQPSQADLPITERAFNVYISGIDVSGPISTTSRSDVNIIMTVNARTHKILLTTTPRDYYVTIPGISGDARDKLTHAGIYGIGASMATLENLYGTHMDEYIRINFTSLIRIVDVLGGVDVQSEYSFSAGGYNFTQGLNHLDGQAALAFSRERYSFASGDNQRGRNQQAVLTAIIEKMQSASVLRNADEVMQVISECMQTSMSKDDMTSLISAQIASNPHWTVESQQATGYGDTQPTYSMGSMQLYVMWPDNEVLPGLSEKIAKTLAE